MKVILLHGLGGSSFDWEAAAAQSQVDARALDLRFHGGRPLDGEVCFDALVDDVMSCLPPHGSVGLAGFSLGSSVAVACASRAPERIQRLLLVAPVWPTRFEPSPSTLKLRKLGRVVSTRGLVFAWDVISAVPPLCNWDDDDRAAYRSRFLAFDPEAFATAVTVLPHERPRVAIDVVADSVKTSVVGWPDDPVHPLTSAKEVAELLRAHLAVEPARPRTRKEETKVLAAHLNEVFGC